jgi:hypothetical protein
MSPHRSVRLPISTRHAFALAFDLAVRRDIVHSLLVPLLLRAPWIIALAVLPAPAESDRPGTVTLLTATALIGDFLMLVLVGAMLRFRARSVFNTRVEVHPAPIGDCYAQGLGRVPWLVVTEIVRNLAILFAACFFVFPGLVLGFRLSFATEAVVLHDPQHERRVQPLVPSDAGPLRALARDDRRVRGAHPGPAVRGRHRIARVPRRQRCRVGRNRRACSSPRRRP